MRKKKGQSITGTGKIADKIKTALPYDLTGAQVRSVDEILTDMAYGDRMLRLLQGDVGAGKTVVALLAMAAAVESGGQAAMMVPTEILARQHGDSLAPLAAAAGLTLKVLTARDKGKERKQILDDLKSGTIDIIVGTHALFQDDVAFHDLKLTVIDEQHRFGVHQRLLLADKGQKPVDVLVMTATPIPRTLMLTAYGDMDVSRLDEKPPGRQPIETRVMGPERVDQLVARLKAQTDDGHQAYWVCPLVEDSDVLDATSAEERHSSLTRALGKDKVGLVHGRMKPAEKDEVMERFAAGELKVLVATTVIEVGVDVPNATIMVIEHANRFGLAQLHQLRGRVGRGDQQSFCLLLYGSNLSATARKRLETLRDTDDGFIIAEQDLKLRGAGELLGTRQSGLPEFRLADLSAHEDLLAMARDDATLLLEKDPDLQSDRGKALRTLLYLFERDQAVSYLSSG